MFAGSVEKRRFHPCVEMLVTIFSFDHGAGLIIFLSSEETVLSDREFVKIGKGMYRVTVRSKAIRNRLARIPGVQVEGTRVIFPEWVSGNIRRILSPPAKKSDRDAEQTDLFPDDPD